MAMAKIRVAVVTAAAVILAIAGIEIIRTFVATPESSQRPRLQRLQTPSRHLSHPENQSHPPLKRYTRPNRER